MTRPLGFRSVLLFDGEDFREGVDVRIEQDRITAVGPGAAADDAVEVVDGDGRTLMPGLIDAHTHTFGTALRQAVVFGVTTELDMFTVWQYAAVMREEQEAGRATDRADLFSAGTCVTCPDGHGTEYGLPIPTINGPEVTKFVRSQGFENVGSTPEAFAERIKSEFARFGRVLNEAGIKPE